MKLKNSAITPLTGSLNQVLADSDALMFLTHRGLAQPWANIVFVRIN
jgi:hypothetical protein